jgi:uncharacterized membrane protein YdjX (TVP38/TMEM64 family)
LYLNAEAFMISVGFFKALIIFLPIITLTVLFVPLLLSPLAVIAGIVFGPLLGSIIILLSATLGAVVAFLIGRYFLHGFFYKKFKKNKIYRKMLEEEHKHILKFLFTSRLFPKLPFDIVSFMAGITTMEVWKFALATFLGMVPLVLILTLFGHLFESYRVLVLGIVVSCSILYAIYKVIRNKRYYVRGY